MAVLVGWRGGHLGLLQDSEDLGLALSALSGPRILGWIPGSGLATGRPFVSYRNNTMQGLGEKKDM